MKRKSGTFDIDGSSACGTTKAHARCGGNGGSSQPPTGWPPLAAQPASCRCVFQFLRPSATERIEFSARLLLSSRRVVKEARRLKSFLSP